MHIEIYGCNMQGTILDRWLHAQISASLAAFPAVAILGPRQCGESTLTLSTDHPACTSCTSNPHTLRVRRLNSTPIR
jgi:hypothetical protein